MWNPAVVGDDGVGQGGSGKGPELSGHTSTARGTHGHSHKSPSFHRRSWRFLIRDSCSRGSRAQGPPTPTEPSRRVMSRGAIGPGISLLVSPQLYAASNYLGRKAEGPRGLPSPSPGPGESWPAEGASRPAKLSVEIAGSQGWEDPLLPELGLVGVRQDHLPPATRVRRAPVGRHPCAAGERLGRKGKQSSCHSQAPGGSSLQH